jgi:hypothetical protein
MKINPEQVRAQIEALKLRYPDLFADEEGWDLTLSSESELDDILAHLVAKEREAAAMAGAIASQVVNLEARQARFERRSKAARELILKLLQSAGVRKRELPAATLSVHAGGTRVVINDEASVPSSFCRIKREPDKTAVKAFLEAGNTPNWASLVKGDEGLTVRFR